jgi:hypothetical protein
LSKTNYLKFKREKICVKQNHIGLLKNIENGVLLIFSVISSRIVTDVDYLISGYFYYETRRATNALVHKDQAYEVYQSICQPRKVHIS